jgi:hypothetical protein
VTSRRPTIATIHIQLPTIPTHFSELNAYSNKPKPQNLYQRHNEYYTQVATNYRTSTDTNTNNFYHRTTDYTTVPHYYHTTHKARKVHPKQQVLANKIGQTSVAKSMQDLIQSSTQ